MTTEPFAAIADEDTFVERFDPAIAALASELVSLARFCHAQGWVRATSGNFSARAGDARVLITASGLDKGALVEGDFLLVDFDAKPERGGTKSPSAETPLHCALYRKRKGVGAVAHTHSVAATVLSRHFARRGSLPLRGYEMAKALGAPSHEAPLALPVFENSQDTVALARHIEARLDGGAVAYLIEGHGLTTWAPDVSSLRRHVDALEFMLACELAALSLPAEGAPRPGPPRPPSRPGLPDKGAAFTTCRGCCARAKTRVRVVIYSIRSFHVARLVIVIDRGGAAARRRSSRGPRATCRLRSGEARGPAMVTEHGSKGGAKARAAGPRSWGGRLGMPPGRAKADRAAAGGAEGADAKHGSGSFLQPEAYVINVDRGGEVFKQTPEGWRRVGQQGLEGLAEPWPSGGEASGVAPRLSDPLSSGRAAAAGSEPPASGRVALGPPEPGVPTAAAGGEGAGAARANAPRTLRLADWGGEAHLVDAMHLEASTLQTLKGIAALREGAAAGALASNGMTEDLDAALEALRNATPVRVSRTRLSFARRRQRARAALWLLAALVVVLSLLALRFWPPARGLVAKASVPSWARAGVEKAAGAVSKALGRGHQLGAGDLG